MSWFVKVNAEANGPHAARDPPVLNAFIRQIVNSS